MIPILRNWVNRYFHDEESVLLLVLIAIVFVVLWTIGTILGPVIAAVIIAFLMQGLLLWLKKKGLPHIVAVTISFLLMFSLMIATLLFLLPVLWQQSAKLLSELPRMVAEWRQLLLLLPEQYPSFVTEEQILHIINHINNELGEFGQSVVSFSVSSIPLLFVALLYMIMVPLLVFFFLKDGRYILNWLGSLLPKERPVMSEIWTEMNQQIANYVRGKVVEILIVGVSSCICFAILGLDYAMLLGLAVGLSVVIPYIGAVAVTVPVLLIGFFQWGWGSELFYLAAVYLVIQGLDGNVLVPLLFSEAVNLHPVAIILAVLVFGGIWGLWGVFFAIPLATLIKAITNAWPTREYATTETSKIDTAQ